LSSGLDVLALTTHGKDNHAVRSERYRYIRYNDGSEELYDMKEDPREWDNLVADGKSEEEKAIIEDLSIALPDINRQSAKNRQN
jgi:hypothetical protein